jgi:hypothetical protein
VLVLGGVAFAGTQIFAGEEEPEPAPNRPTETAGGPSSGSTDGGSDRAAAARPETVVVVLNGTPAIGLAADRGEKLIAEGYSDEPGMVRTGNNTDQQRQDSIVLFRSGERRQARDVATILDIDTIESIDPETQAFADLTDETGRDLTADVTVILGLDQAP